jgi:hypothetical protein
VGPADPLVTRALDGYRPSGAEAGRLWIESWHFGIRDAEMRADTLRDYAAWRRLVAGTVQRGISSGLFTTPPAPARIAMLALALVDGIGIRSPWAIRRLPRTVPRPMCWPLWPRAMT